MVLASDIAALRIAAVDAYLADRSPFASDLSCTRITLPAGTPWERAQARDNAIVSLAACSPGQRVGVVGVVTPLVRALIDQGCTVVLADRGISTCLGMKVHDEGEDVVHEVDTMIVTGMTLVDGSFDRIRTRCIRLGIPLLVYAQSGAAIVREFIGSGVTSLNAEPFPFSQFSAESSTIFQYTAGTNHASPLT
nr:DUF364 domain-containing protein [Corynebacterium ciconiae]